MSIRSLTFQVVAMMAIPAFAAYHEDTPYDFTFSSFAREGAMTLRTEGEAKGTYTLGQELSRTITWPNGTTSELETPLFDKQVSLDALVGDGGMLEGEALRPISYVPNGLTVTAVSIVTPGDVAPETLTLTVGKTAHTLLRTGATEAVTLRGTWDNVAGTRSGTVHTYAPRNDETIALAGADASFSVAFPATDASGQQQNRSIYLLDGAPFLRLFGTAKIKHHIFKIDQQAGTARQSLAELLKGLFSVPVSGGTQRRRKIKGYLIFFMYLAYIYGVDPGFGNAQKGNAAEDSGVRKMSAPVPAIHIMGFPDMAEAFPGILCAPGGTVGKGLVCRF